MAGYIRQDVSNNIANGNVIDADDFDNEFDAIADAFSASTGHKHDGSGAEGAPITVTGPAQEYVSTNTEFRPKTNNAYDLGSVANQWKNLYVDGTANLDSVDIDGGTIDGTVIGGSTPAAISGTTIDGTSITATGSMIAGGTGSVGYTSLNQIVAKGTDNAGIVVDSGTASLGRLAFGDGALAGYVEYDHSDNSMRFSVGSERMRITSGGNVGIGTNTPSSSAKLDVRGRIRNNGRIEREHSTFSDWIVQAVDLNDSFSSSGGLWWSNTSDAVGLFNGNAGSGIFALNTSQTVTFNTNFNERMRIDSSGNVGIGTTTPGSKLSIVGLPTSSAGLSAGDIWNDGGTLKIV